MAESTRTTPAPRPAPSTGSGEPASALQSTGKYRLLVPHIIADRRLEAGTEVGTDTPYPCTASPSTEMAGLDGAGKAAVEKLHMEKFGKAPPWGDMTAQGAEDARRAIEEAAADPVSYTQARERGLKQYKGVSTESPFPPGSVLPTSLGGDQSHTFGEYRDTIINAPPRI